MGIGSMSCSAVPGGCAGEKTGGWCCCYQRFSRPVCARSRGVRTISFAMSETNSHPLFSYARYARCRSGDVVLACCPAHIGQFRYVRFTIECRLKWVATTARLLAIIIGGGGGGVGGELALRNDIHTRLRFLVLQVPYIPGGQGTGSAIWAHAFAVALTAFQERYGFEDGVDLFYAW